MKEQENYPYHYDQLKNHLEKTGLRQIANFNKIMQQFILRCGDQWEAPFAEFYGDLLESPVIEGEMEKGETYLEEHYSSTAQETAVNDFWKNKDNAENFIHLLVDYREKFDQTNDGQLLNFAAYINNDPWRYIYEILQNADDCLYPDHVLRSFTVDLSEPGKIKVHYNECGMGHLDIISLTTLGKSTKKDRKKKLIGEKGIGFKTIFAACDKVEIYSGGYSFSLVGNSFQPTFIDNKVEQPGTTLVLHLKEEKSTGKEDVFTTLLAQYGYKDGAIHPETAFQQCPILFTNHLDWITLKKGSFSFTVKREGNEELSLCYTFGQEGQQQSFVMDCFARRKAVTFRFEEYASRYPEQYTKETFPKEGENQEAITYDIVIVAPKKLSELSPSFCGNLYSFLPTSTRIKAPFNLQIPLKLNLDRSCMWCKEDQDTSGADFHVDEYDTISWNTRLWKETYGLMEEFYQYLQNKVDVVDYAPYFQKNDHCLLKAEGKLYEAGVKKLNDFCAACQVEDKNLFDTFAQIAYFKGYEEDSYYTAEYAAMFDPFIMDTLKATYFKQWNNGKKHLVAFHEKGEKLQAWCKNFRIEVAEEAKTPLLNACFSEVEQREKVLQAYMDGTSLSVYLPTEPFGLEIFQVRGTEKETFLSYTPPEGKKRFWFYTEKELPCYGQDSLCFWDISREVVENFRNIYQKDMEMTEVRVPMDVFATLSKDKSLNQEDLEELMKFLAGNLDRETEWNVYAQRILKGQDGNWKDGEVQRFAKMILQAKGGQ